MSTGGAKMKQTIRILILVTLASMSLCCLASEEEKPRAALTNDFRTELVENLKKRIISEKLDQKAEDARLKAISNPNDANLLCAYGQALLNLSGAGVDTNTLSQAESPLERAVELDPGNATNHLWLGLYWKTLGCSRGISITNTSDSLRDFEKAKEHLLESQKLKPTMSRIKVNIAEVDTLCDEKRMWLAHMEKMQTLRLKHEKIRNEANTNEVEFNDAQSGKKYRMNVSRLSPEQEKNLFELETAVLNDPQNPDKRIQYAQRLSQCRTQRNDKDKKMLAKMKEQLDFVLANDKGHLVALSLLGDYYRQMGDVKQAVITFQEVFAKGKPPVEALEGAHRIANDRETFENMVRVGVSSASNDLEYAKQAEELLKPYSNVTETIARYAAHKAEEDLKRDIGKSEK
jgi:cytochrome c-type biogenesis protein CcmH/NrfG